LFIKMMKKIKLPLILSGLLVTGILAAGFVIAHAASPMLFGINPITPFTQTLPPFNASVDNCTAQDKARPLIMEPGQTASVAFSLLYGPGFSSGYPTMGIGAAGIGYTPNIGYIPLAYPFTCLASGGANSVGNLNIVNGADCNAIFNNNVSGQTTGSATYTITANSDAAPGYYAFGANSNYLSQVIESDFCVEVVPPEGNIIVRSVDTDGNPVSASWMVSGPATISDNGVSMTYTNEPLGSYTITPGPTPSGYQDNPTIAPASAQSALTSGGTIIFIMMWQKLPAAVPVLSAAWSDGENATSVTLAPGQTSVSVPLQFSNTGGAGSVVSETGCFAFSANPGVHAISDCPPVQLTAP
jgi:hypothetical protein